MKAKRDAFRMSSFNKGKTPSIIVEDKSSKELRTSDAEDGKDKKAGSRKDSKDGKEGNDDKNGDATLKEPSAKESKLSSAKQRRYGLTLSYSFD